MISASNYELVNEKAQEQIVNILIDKNEDFNIALDHNMIFVGHQVQKREDCEIKA